ncbi:hypothetical protein EG68_00925 [Paragonimus skrjabini miyazakii]|uniref:Uncharacterized protein n=1 Tax=Paragonimus skrjabini miyazakii TaxID=59628 RepID=A0A8S9Z2S7_9TREM|nr:hypothetical protein EG68_00925 [Paragonimus skrjabini miyazakii]
MSTGKRKSEATKEVNLKKTSIEEGIAPISHYASKLESIRLGFYLNFPEEFVRFYEFCSKLDESKPLEVLHSVAQVRLVGPFELLHESRSGRIEPGQFALCYRYFHDPPELVTILTGPGQLHFGCFRDDPNEVPSAIVRSDPSIQGSLTLYAPNLFAAIRTLLTDKPNSEFILKKLENFANVHNISLSMTGTEFRERRSKCVCPTLNTIGLHIKLREGGVGYRPLSLSNQKLQSLLQAVTNVKSKEAQLSKLEPIDVLITCSQFACDEGDYGQSLELGLSMLAFQPKGLSLEKYDTFNSRIKHLLTVGYELAGRPEFADVIQKHMIARSVHPPTFELDNTSTT